MSWFGSFTLLNPLYLIGLASAAIPLIIHLSRSRRTKTMRFSTTRFFTDQFLRSYRMSRLKELMLLLCRMALFALFALALTEPLFLPRGPSLLGGKGARSVVLVLDNSASMGYVEDGETLLKRAKDAALNVLANLGSGDSATVILAGRRAEGPEVLFRELTEQHADVKEAISRLQPVALGTDLTGAISQAETLLRSSQAPNKEVYVFSDLQDSGWEIPDEKQARTDAATVSYFFLRVQPKKAVVNRGVTAVQYGAARPMVGVPFAIRPLLSISGDDRKEIKVRLYVDGEKVGEQSVERLQTGRWAVPRFYHTFAKGGWHSGHVEVDDQTMTLDNHRYFTVEVLEKVKLLAVDGAPSQIPRLDELFFLRLALTASPEGQESPFEVKAIGAPDLAAADLAAYPLLILANVESLSDAAVEKLEDFAAGGGSVLVFLGDKVNSRFYNDILAARDRRHGGLLPGRLIRIEGDPAGKKNIAFIGGVNYDHPALNTFQDSRFATLLGPSVTFKALWQVEAPAPSVLMRASNGSPLLCEKGYGKGRVMLFTSTCDRDWTNFPIRPAFLPWSYRLAAYLAQKPLGHQAFHTTGDVVRLPRGAGEANPTLLVEKPDHTLATATLDRGASAAYVFGDTTQSGIYTIRKQDQAGTAGLFAVNLDNYESDLTYLDDVLALRAGVATGNDRTAAVEGELKKLLDRPVVTYVDDSSRMGEVFGTARHGVKLWDWFLIAVLIIGLLEPWLANRISARLYAKPREVPSLSSPSRGPGQTAAFRRTPERETVEGGTR